jgi:hypothetical protein
MGVTRADGTAAWDLTVRALIARNTIWLAVAMLIVLPCVHQGGELVIGHAGREARVDLGSSEVSELRFAALHELPTVAESGVPGFDVTGWYGLVAPRTTSRSVVGKVHGELSRILASEEFRRHLAAEGAEARPSTPEKFGGTIADEIRKWEKVVRAARIDLR